ncbi:MAG: hypothetical protein HY064_12295 [Bacteroidetes bacterium]|nr:hypothetical protein [Bacteroidota bacterium]
MKRSAKNKFAYINTVVFTTLLTVFGILFLFQKHGGVSEVEKRQLSPIPVFSWDSLFYGNYIDSIDLFVADNFPYRDKLVDFSFKLKDARGFKDKSIGFYTKPKKMLTGTSIPLKKSDSLNDSAIVDSDIPAEGGEEVDNLLIYNGRAMEIFGGNDRMAKAYADVVNKYEVALAGKATVYAVVVPSSIEFNSPGNYRGKEKHNIQAMYSNMMPGVKCVDAYSLIAAHQNEYVYYKTDHHWTGLGAYYAYVAFCNTAGITALSLSQMEMKSKTNYLGSLYWDTRDSRLKDNADTVFYWKIPNAFKPYMYTKKNQEKAVGGSLYAEHASGANSYGVFLGGDYPMVRIDSDVKNGRKVVIVKNSYGNPFSTYFPAHFEQTFVVDYRYYNYNLLDLIEKNGITDVIFINGVFSANTSWHLHMMEKLMKNPKSNAPAQKEDVPSNKDSLKAKESDSIKKPKKEKN